MPIDANTFNSRVTSEALEEKFRQVFPAQGGAELVQDLFASGVITPVVDFSSVAEGSVLPESLQQAWDFGTGLTSFKGPSTQTLVTNTGFWKVDLNCTFAYADTITANIFIDDGTTQKDVWHLTEDITNTVAELFSVTQGSFIVFLRAGDSLKATCSTDNIRLDVWYRQIADVNGTLVNPLGFSFT